MPSRRSRPHASSTQSSDHQSTDGVRPDPPSRPRGQIAANHLTSQTRRTPVACDRCKDRKIKCDTSTGRCGQCKENDVPCHVTDRNTGERHRRGQLDELIVAINSKDEEICRLRKKLQELGQPVPQTDNDESPDDDQDAGQAASIVAFNNSRVGQNYLGAAGHPNLSMLQGSQMTLFGQSFDLNNFFVRPEKNNMFELSKTEYKSHVLDQMSARKPSFPPRTEAMNAAHLFFAGIAFFTPVVHRPAFFNMMERKYDFKQGIDLTTTEQVIFHMVMSLAEFQIAVRTRNQQLGISAKERLIWSLTNVNQLLHDEDMAAMQALTLICLAMRALQRPGPAWSFCDQVLTRAMELGMHRSLSAWSQEPEKRTAESEQMRRRIFWTLLVVHVNISGNLGLPMRLRYEDIDIEMPDVTPDHMPGEPETGICTWRYAPYGFKLTQIMLQVYSTVCTVRTPMVDNDRNAFDLNKQLLDLENTLPPECPQPPQQIQGQEAVTAYVCGLYLRLGIYATRLIVCHPRHLRSHPFENSPHHLDILMKTSRSILAVAEELKLYQSLDTTVYYTMDFIYAIFVALFVASQQHSHFGIDSVKKDMQRWRDVLQAVGDMLGTGLALRDAIHRITIGVMDRIKEDTEMEAGTQQGTSMSPTMSIPTASSDENNVFSGTAAQQPFSIQPNGTAQHARAYSPQSNGASQQTQGYSPQHDMVQQSVLPPVHPLQQVQHGGYNVDIDHHDGLPPEHHGTIPTDSMLQSYDGVYHGAQVWHNTVNTADTAAYGLRDLPIDPRNGNTMQGHSHYDMAPWPEYYIGPQ